MNELVGSWSDVNWIDPRILGTLAIVLLAAVVRRWSLILLLVLVIALGQGLAYLLSHSSLGHEFTRGAVIGVYVFGGLLLLFLAIAHYVTRD